MLIVLTDNLGRCRQSIAVLLAAPRLWSDIIMKGLLYMRVTSKAFHKSSSELYYFSFWLKKSHCLLLGCIVHVFFLVTTTGVHVDAVVVF